MIEPTRYRRLDFDGNGTVETRDIFSIAGSPSLTIRCPHDSIGGEDLLLTMQRLPEPASLQYGTGLGADQRTVDVTRSGDVTIDSREYMDDVPNVNVNVNLSTIDSGSTVNGNYNPTPSPSPTVEPNPSPTLIRRRLLTGAVANALSIAHGISESDSGSVSDDFTGSHAHSATIAIAIAGALRSDHHSASALDSQERRRVRLELHGHRRVRCSGFCERAGNLEVTETSTYNFRSPR